MGSQIIQATCSLPSAAERSAGCSATHFSGPLENFRRLSLDTPSANQLEWQPALWQLTGRYNHLGIQFIHYFQFPFKEQKRKTLQLIMLPST